MVHNSSTLFTLHFTVFYHFRRLSTTTMSEYYVHMLPQKTSRLSFTHYFSLYIVLLQISRFTKACPWGRAGSEPALYAECELSAASPGLHLRPPAPLRRSSLSLLTRGTMMCSLQPPPPFPFFSNVFIYPLIQGINQGQHTMPHTAIKIHCNANSPVASALHWQVLTRRATRKQPHMNAHKDTHIYQLTDSVNCLPEGGDWAEKYVSLRHRFPSRFLS